MEPQPAMRCRLRAAGNSSQLQLLTFCCSLLLASALVAMPSIGVAAEAADGSDNGDGGASPALAYCNSPEGRSLKCGWESGNELEASGADYCDSCGSVWGPAPDEMPVNMSTNGRAFYFVAGRYVSLGCDGPVVVRAVTKLIDAGDLLTPGRDCVAHYLDGSWFTRGGEEVRASVVRCELQLPNGTEPEEQRALRSTEVNCYQCTRCSRGGGCPSRPGVWYSDSFTYNATGCASLRSGLKLPGKGKYTYVRPGLTVNPTVEFTLAKFEVCNQPSCYDAAYEATKLKNAKVCRDAKCPK